MQRNNAGHGRTALRNQCMPNSSKKNADDELQKVQRNPIKEWPHRKHQEGKQHKAGKGAETRRPPTTDRGDRKHDRQCLDSFDN